MPYIPDGFPGGRPLRGGDPPPREGRADAAAEPEEHARELEERRRAHTPVARSGVMRTTARPHITWHEPYGRPPVQPRHRTPAIPRGAADDDDHLDQLDYPPTQQGFNDDTDARLGLAPRSPPHPAEPELSQPRRRRLPPGRRRSFLAAHVRGELVGDDAHHVSPYSFHDGTAFTDGTPSRNRSSRYTERGPRHRDGPESRSRSHSPPSDRR